MPAPLPTFVSAGTYSAAISGTVTAGAPASRAAGDLLLLFVESANSFIATPSNWGLVATAQGTGTAGNIAATGLTVFWRFDPTGSTAMPTITVGTDHTGAVCLAFRGVDPTTPIHAVAGSALAVASTAISFPSVVTTAANCLIVCAVSNSTDSNTAQMGAITNASLASITERSDNNSNAGGGSGIGIITGTRAVAGTVTANSAGSLTTSSIQALFTIALQPPVTQTLTPSLFSDNDTIIFPSGGAPAVWDDNDNSVTLSNGDKTATVASNGSVSSATPIAAKTYFEFVVTGSFTTEVLYLGVGDTTVDFVGDITNAGDTGFSNSWIASTTAPGVFLNGAGFGTYATGNLVSGDRICVAFDPATNKIWFRKNGGLWNNTSDDPAAPTGGFSDPSFTAVTSRAVGYMPHSAASATLCATAADWVYLAPSGFGELTGPGAPSVTQGAPGAPNLAPPLYSDADSFFAPIVTTGGVTVSAAVYTDADTFHSAAVAARYALTPALYSDADTFFAPAVTVGAAALTPSLFTDVDAFFPATVSRGAVTLAPALYADADAFFAPTVTPVLAPSLFTDPNSFYSATVSVGAVTLTPSLFGEGDTFYTPGVSQTFLTLNLDPSQFTDADSFFAHTVSTSVALTPALYGDADAFFSATITGTIALAPSLFSDGDAFVPPAVTTGIVTLGPGLFADADTFFTPAASLTIYTALFAETETFFAATVSNSLTLTPDPLTDADSFYAAMISATVPDVDAPAALLI